MIPRTSSVVEISQVSKCFGDTVAVRDLSLSIPEGSIYGFIGPNGSGKTTTMRMMVNILRPDRGSITVFGAPLKGSVVDEIGYMPEERGLYKKMKLRDVLLFYGRLKRKGPAVESQVDTWLKRLDLEPWAGKRVETLSKGMAQKAQLIATVASSPKLLILDEPLAGLDPVNAEVIREAISGIRERGTTVILSTHDMAAAEELCDFIFMIFQGSKVLDGTLAGIQAEYGGSMLRVEFETGGPGGASPGEAELAAMEGVEGVVPRSSGFDLTLSPSADAQIVLAGLMGRARIRKAEVAQPSLHEIFLRIAGPRARGEDAIHA